ncbi:hypothetical protein D3C71_555740 [compost metagenome]
MALARGKDDRIAGRMHRHHAGFLQRHRIGKFGSIGLLRRPERMIGGKRQRQKEFQRPIGGACRIIALAHHQVRIAVADGEYAVALSDRKL